MNNHDVYAAEYDKQVEAYQVHIADLLFGLSYEYIHPGMRVLDVGIGSGLSALLFAKAGLKISGIDFSSTMLDICRAKRITDDLILHDIEQAPWPYPDTIFDALVCCGVLHFLPALEIFFSEAKRVLKKNGLCAFTTKYLSVPADEGTKATQQTIDGFEIYAHHPSYLEAILEGNTFKLLKQQHCLVGKDIFTIWVAQKANY
jgi:ubiquinone/menaquinone biosynthesis C-methylase UbiE